MRKEIFDIMNDIKNYDEVVFEKIKHLNENGVEFWYARDLQLLLEYETWKIFLKVVEKAKEACTGSGFNVLDNFESITKTIDNDLETYCEIEDIKLTRYACYLIIQNADSSKKMVALSQQYLYSQTRKQEIIEQIRNSATSDFSKYAANLFINTQSKNRLKKEKLEIEENKK